MVDGASGWSRLTSDGRAKNPTAEWVARQITEAFPWDGAPGYMIRDRDRIYGGVVARRLRAMNPAMLCPLLQRCQNASIIG
jgi:hypothetical protein